MTFGRNLVALRRDSISIDGAPKKVIDMMRVAVLILASLVYCATAWSEVPKAEQVTFSAADGVTVYADRYLQHSSPLTIILMHQARANGRSEYAAIVPKLLARGWSVLAVDLRSGGQLFGGYNRTVAEHPTAKSYCAAIPDAQAAIDYIKAHRPSDKVVLWGSSYSAALAIRLAATDGNADAALAFSPASGKPMDGCRPESVFDDVAVPVLIFRPAREAEVASVVAQIEAAKKSGHEVHIAENGVHGSSMLVEQRTGSDTSVEWDRVLRFLDSL